MGNYWLGNFLLPADYGIVGWFPARPFAILSLAKKKLLKGCVDEKVLE